MKNLKLIIKIICVMFLFVKASILSAQVPPPKIAVPPKFYTTCFETIYAQSFEPNAMRPMEDLDMEYGIFITNLKLAIDKSYHSIIANVNKSLSEVSEIYAKVQEDQLRKRMEIKSELISYENQFKSHKQALEQKLESSLFPNEINKNGEVDVNSPQYKYYENICTNQKIAENTFGTKKRQKENAKVNLQVERSTIEQLNRSSVASTLTEQQQEMTQKYCSDSEMSAGLCDSVSPMPYGNLSAQTFLHPTGDFNKNENSPSFKTRFTYSDAEKTAARDYMKTVVQPLAVTPPQLSEINSRSKQPFLQYYNHLMSNLNLANYTFALAFNNRVPSSTGNLPMSKYDTYRYMIHKKSHPDAISAIKASGGNGQYYELHQNLVLNSKLQLEIYLQKRRQNLLDAAILALQENDAIELQYLEDLK
tara:strand:+ start:11113 stop:12372 length:1260 start_codon:yes stop_codon:yes gene_type:complete